MKKNTTTIKARPQIAVNPIACPFPYRPVIRESFKMLEKSTDLFCRHGHPFTREIMPVIWEDRALTYDRNRMTRRNAPVVWVDLHTRSGAQIGGLQNLDFGKQLNNCELCRPSKPRRAFFMPDTWDRYDPEIGESYRISDEELEEERTNPLEIFKDWDDGEAGYAMAEHTSKLSGLQRLISEDCILSGNTVNRINTSAGSTTDAPTLKTFTGYTWESASKRADSQMFTFEVTKNLKGYAWESASKRARSQMFNFEVTEPTASNPVKSVHFAEDRRPHYDRLDTLAYSLGMVDKETKRIDPLVGVILDAFRSLELDETARKQLTLQIRMDRTKAHEIIHCAKELSKEIIPPTPSMTPDVILDRQCFQIFGLPVVEAPEEIEPSAQPESYATPLGPVDGTDYIGYRRSPIFRKYLDRIATAVQSLDGKTLATIGKQLYAQTGFIGKEKGVIFHIRNIAIDRVEHTLRHRHEALLRRIGNHPNPKKLGKPLFDLAKYQGKDRPKFTTAQWSAIWDAYRARVPKPEQSTFLPPEPPPFTDEYLDAIDDSAFFECPEY